MKGDSPRPGEGKGPNASNTQDTNPMLEAASSYTELGWAVLPLHGISTEGTCTCSRGADCHSPGKHPRTPNGIHDASHDPDTLKRWFSPSAGTNVAIATGAVSNLIVIDIDMHDDGEGKPVDGEVSLQALIEELGPLPPTVEAQTGGGGKHLLFRHPGTVVRNSSSKLGPGLDVKADGGCIVAAPSRHREGILYQWEASSLPGETEVAQLPEAWLKAITRPPGTSPKASGDAMGWDAPLDKARILNGLPLGERDQMIYLEASSLRGRGFHRSEAEVIIREIAARCDPPFAEAEAVKKIDWVYGQHQPNGDGYGVVNQQLDSARRVITAVLPQIEKSIEFARKPAILERLAVVAELDPISLEGVMVKLRQVHDDQAVADLKETVKGATSGITDTASKPRFPIIFGDDIESLPAPEWQVENVLVKGSLAFLYGKPGIGKSFAALDISGSVAAGIDWHGHEVIEGKTVYVVAEGLGDFGLRVQAFRLARGLDSLPGAAYILESVNLFLGNGVEADHLGDMLAEWDPSFVVFDTLARCSVGGDENWAKDMGIVIAATDRLRNDLKTTVLIVAHTGKDGKLLRGSSALEGAADTTIKAEVKSGMLNLKCEKQKMAAKFDTLSFRLEQSGKSVALVPASVGTKLTDIQRLGAKLVPPEGITHGDWKSEFVKAGGKEGSFRNVLEYLNNNGHIEKKSDGKGALYFLTDEGQKHV